jgi:hypothetical protein
VPGKNEQAASGDKVPFGLKYREDLLFYYYVLVNSRDMVNLQKTILTIIRDGWRVQDTWKMILFPWLGPKTIRSGVRIKSWLRSINA